jgi:hypothetical protein
MQPLALLAEADNGVHNTYKIYPELPVPGVEAAAAVAAAKAFRLLKVFNFKIQMFPASEQC